MCKSDRKTKRNTTGFLFKSCLILLLPVSTFAASELEVLKLEVEQLKKDVKQAKEWSNPNSLIHMAGYADVGYISDDNPATEDSFSVGTFAPIFHYQYRDLVMLESELEIELAEDGSTEIKLEYLTIDWMINDYAVLVAGQFLSPIGNFRQNLHPSWINKLPSAPPGFGHDGAAPVSDLGVQLRGGFYLGDMKANYSLYVGNGPEVKAEIEDDGLGGIDEIEFDGVDAEAFGADADGDKVFGGRLGLFPLKSLEVGVSFLSGDATVTEYEGGDPTGGSAPSLDGISGSAYDVIGVDISYQRKAVDLRYEYVATEMSAITIGGFDLQAAEWTTWYAQGAYRFLPSKYEAVIRVSEFDSPHDSNDQEQLALGINYLFSNNFIGKLGFESNDNPNVGQTAYDRWMLQLAYGF